MQQAPAIVVFIAVMITLWAFFYRRYDFRIHFIIALADFIGFILTFTSCYYMPIATVCNITTIDVNVTMQICKTEYTSNPYVVYTLALLILGFVHLFWAIYLKVSGIVQEVAAVLFE